MVPVKNIDEINHRIVFAEARVSLVGLCSWKSRYFVL